MEQTYTLPELLRLQSEGRSFGFQGLTLGPVTQAGEDRYSMEFRNAEGRVIGVVSGPGETKVQGVEL